MDKLALYYDKVFWEEDADWLNYISDKPGHWVQALNLFKYTGVPILVWFNAGDQTKYFSSFTDDEILENIQDVMTTMYGAAAEEAKLVGYARTNWGNEKYT